MQRTGNGGAHLHLSTHKMHAGVMVVRFRGAIRGKIETCDSDRHRICSYYKLCVTIVLLPLLLLPVCSRCLQYMYCIMVYYDFIVVFIAIVFTYIVYTNLAIDLLALAYRMRGLFK